MAMLKKWFLRLFGLVLFLAALIWASDNSDPVQLAFLDFKTPAWPVSWWMLAAFLVGVFTGVAMNIWHNAGLKLAVRKARKATEKEQRKLDAINAAGAALPGTPVAVDRPKAVESSTAG